MKCHCGATINAMTGLQELQKLQAHMKKKHQQTLDLIQAANLRVQLEGDEETAAVRSNFLGNLTFR